MQGKLPFNLEAYVVRTCRTVTHLVPQDQRQYFRVENQYARLDQVGTFTADGAIGTVKTMKRILPEAASNMERDLRQAQQALTALRLAKERRQPATRFEQLKSYFAPSSAQR